jgi:hypothetical protein
MAGRMTRWPHAAEMDKATAIAASNADNVT